jgi:hypothetical protein
VTFGDSAFTPLLGFLVLLNEIIHPWTWASAFIFLPSWWIHLHPANLINNQALKIFPISFFSCYFYIIKKVFCVRGRGVKMLKEGEYGVNIVFTCM